MPTDQDSNAVFLDPDFPIPKVLPHVTILLESRQPAGELVAPPCWLWVRSGDLIMQRGGRGEYRGTLKMIAKANNKRASIARSAALVGEVNSDAERQAILRLAAWRTLGRLSAALKSGADAQARALLPLIHGTSINEFWQSKTTHTLPGEPEGLRTIPDEGSAHRIVADWLEAISGEFCAVRMIGRSSERRGAIRSGGYMATIEGFGGAERYEVPGTAEWHQVTDQELERLTKTHSGEELAARFGVSRTSIGKACRRRGVTPPKQRPGRPRGKKSA